MRPPVLSDIGRQNRVPIGLVIACKREMTGGVRFDAAVTNRRMKMCGTDISSFLLFRVPEDCPPELRVRGIDNCPFVSTKTVAVMDLLARRVKTVRFQKEFARQRTAHRGGILVFFTHPFFQNIRKRARDTGLLPGRLNARLAGDPLFQRNRNIAKAPFHSTNTV